MSFKKNKWTLPESDICSHHWVHNAGKQCEWDDWSLSDSIAGTAPEDYVKDSNNICTFYICTMCGEEFWSQDQILDIPHYRVRSRKRGDKECKR